MKKKTKKVTPMTELDKIEKYANEMYFKIMDFEEISPYRRELYGKKLEIINRALNDYLNTTKTNNFNEKAIKYYFSYNAN